MGNPITDRSSLPSLKTQGCCFCLTLKIGAILIGIVNIFEFMAWIGSSASSGGLAYLALLLAFCYLGSAVFTLLGVFKGRADWVFFSVYAHLGIIVLSIILAIILFTAKGGVGYGISMLITGIIAGYFAVVLRSYAFEIEDGVAGTNPA